MLEDRAFTDDLTAFGREVAGTFTRERFAAGLLAAYERALGGT